MKIIRTVTDTQSPEFGQVTEIHIPDPPQALNGTEQCRAMTRAKAAALIKRGDKVGGLALLSSIGE